MATKRFCDKCDRSMNCTTGFSFGVDLSMTAQVKMQVQPTGGGDICPRCISDAVLRFVDTNYPPLTPTKPDVLRTKNVLPKHR